MKEKAIGKVIEELRQAGYDNIQLMGREGCPMER